MNLENEKLHAGMTVALLALVLLVFTAADLLKADRLFSETENRVLAQKPKLSLEGIPVSYPHMTLPTICSV